MKAIVVFHSQVERAHPLARFMKPGFWHCFVVVCSDDLWILIDGHMGVPVVKYVAKDDGFDLAAFYRSQGCVVVEMEQREACPVLPLTWRSCVGLVKAVLGVRSWAVTPYQLYRYLEGK